MGFIRPALPDFDLDEWRSLSRMERVRPMAQSWAEAGFGTPEAVYLVYVVKFVAYAVGALWIASLTAGLGGLGSVADWWAEPFVFQKVVAFTMLFEVLGLGCGFGPLTMRFLPPVGAFLHWLRPGTIRLPPWPNRMVGTRGTTRTVGDVLLYAALIAALGWALAAPPIEAGLAGHIGLIEPVRFVPILLLLALAGLRDKTIFLAARTEVYGSFMLVFLLSGADVVIGSKLVMLVIWWGAATSKLNRHFPFVVSVMLSNSPILPRRLKRSFHRSHPDDIRPSRRSTLLAHGGTVFEFVVPAILVFSTGGSLTVAAAVAMIGFHLLILSSLPMGVPLEWNIFMIYGIAVVMVNHAGLGLSALSNPIGVGAIVAVLALVVVSGNIRPDLFSFLISMRYYAGNWATSLWAMTPAAIDKLESNVTKVATLPIQQVERLYGPELAEVIGHKGYAFRSMHSHGRALFGLLPRATGPGCETDYVPMDGEFVAGSVLGWNFGEGHLHDEQLIDALQERCRFQPGEVRVVILEGQPILKPRQHYRLVDAATGTLESGHVAVADMLARQPWCSDIPVSTMAGERASARDV